MKEEEVSLHQKLDKLKATIKEDEYNNFLNNVPSKNNSIASVSSNEINNLSKINRAQNASQDSNNITQIDAY